MNSPRKIFHLVSYLQYPLLLAGVWYYIPFLQSLLNHEPDYFYLNNVLIFFGVAISFSSLQDPRKTQNKLSRKIWQSPRKGKLAIIYIAALAFSFIIGGLTAMYLTSSQESQGISVGITVLGIGLIGLLKTAIEMFENHRNDKNPQ